MPLLHLKKIPFIYDSVAEKWKPKKCPLDDVFKGIVLFLEAAMYEPATQIAGAEVIFDMDGLTMQQAWQFTPQFAKRIVDWLQVCVLILIIKDK